MIWSAEAVTALLVIAGGPVPAPVTERIKAAIGRTWLVGGSQVHLEWGRIDPRVTIANDAGFRLFGGGLEGRFVVAVRTSSGSETAIGIRAGVVDSVWVAARPLAAGTRLGQADLRRDERLLWGAPAARGGPSPIGWTAQRPVPEGEPLRAPLISEPPIIDVGDRIQFLWERDGLQIVREGIATNRARRGDRVTARDPNRAETIQGIATGAGSARLTTKERR